MIPADFDEHFQALGLKPEAGYETVRARARRLLFLHHPDRNADDAFARFQYARVAHAYRTLCDAFARHGRDHPRGRCHGCGELDRLYRGIDGNHYCLVCASDARGRRALPAPPIAMVWCVGPALMLLAAVVLLFHGLLTGSVRALGGSVVSAGVVLLWLLLLCLRIRYTVSRDERSRLARR
jgi:hypothetical protein